MPDTDAHRARLIRLVPALHLAGMALLAEIDEARDAPLLAKPVAELDDRALREAIDELGRLLQDAAVVTGLPLDMPLRLTQPATSYVESGRPGNGDVHQEVGSNAQAR